ncbi:NAD dependent epimerase/dehydratase [Spironucleus salmonicida]|uniref:NAD dependent epimerase/dehydratase n=1 Tax=Spironucleus salmonicida TaxID=348837 RepID=V6LCI0_9EUKA|nr:NAD dependent epimerase/dehydratase [Spironucleus salmonicida]|eukprot:EST41381.1 NAD dependent epimerase/dehydratase [Spironucleus salmonicida]
MSSQKSYLILGGSGFIARHVLAYLADESTTQSITIADKLPFELSNPTPSQTEILENQELCSFIQADLTRQDHLDRVFNQKFDTIINCAGTSELGLDPEIYTKNIVQLAKLTVQRAKNAHYVYISDAKVYKADTKSLSESSKIQPQNALAAAHLEAENVVKSLKNSLILRVSGVYGPGERFCVMPRVVLASLYQLKLKTVLKLPFTAKTSFSTVHVRDVAKFACSSISGVFNVSDPGFTTLNDINDILMTIYKNDLKIEFLSGAVNLALKAATKLAAESINQQHMKPWGELCKELKLESDLSPFMSYESLQEANFNIDGTAISKATGEEYRHQKINAGLVLEEINFWRKLKALPE